MHHEGKIFLGVAPTKRALPTLLSSFLLFFLHSCSNSKMPAYASRSFQRSISNDTAILGLNSSGLACLINFFRTVLSASYSLKLFRALDTVSSVNPRLRLISQIARFIL